MVDETTRLLLNICQGDSDAVNHLAPLVYDQLKAIAARQLRNERSDHSLQATALVHEAFLKLVDQRRVQWQGRAHFCAVAAQLMRRILVDHARHRGAIKRGGDTPRLPLSETMLMVDDDLTLDLVSLDETLKDLEGFNARHARVVELRFFAGLSVEETAHVLDVSASTVKADWRMARAWLLHRLTDD